jgi:hypothetical protein
MNLGDLQRDLRGLSPTPPKKNILWSSLEHCWSISEQDSLAVGLTLRDSFSGGVRFESLPGHRLYWLKFFVVFSVPPAKCWDSTWGKPQLFLSKSPPIHPPVIRHSTSERIKISYKKEVTKVSWNFLTPKNETKICSTVRFEIRLLSLWNTFCLVWTILYKIK